MKSLHLTVTVWLQIIKVLGRSDTNDNNLCQVIEGKIYSFLPWFMFPRLPVDLPLCLWPVFLWASKGRCKSGAQTWRNKAHSQQSGISGQSLQQQCSLVVKVMKALSNSKRIVQILGSFKGSLCWSQTVQEFQQHIKFWNLCTIVTYSCQDTVPKRTQEIKDKKNLWIAYSRVSSQLP